MTRCHRARPLQTAAIALLLTLTGALCFEAFGQDRRQPSPVQEPRADIQGATRKPQSPRVELSPGPEEPTQDPASARAESQAQAPPESPSPVQEGTETSAPENSPAPAPNQVTKNAVGGGDGITISSADGNYSLQLGIIGQFRLRVYDRTLYRRVNRTTVTPPIPVEQIGQVERTFNIRLLRLYLRGNAFRPWLTYKLETDMVSSDQGLREVFIPPVDPVTGSNAVLLRAGAETLDGRTVKLVDFYLDGAPRPYAGFRLGQFKVPFGRQEIVPDHLLQMPERSIASNFFAPGRDRGMVFKGATEEGKIGYQVGAFNGTGIEQAQNIDDSLAYAFRLTGTAGGRYLDIESLVDAPAEFHAQGGASWYDNTRRTTQTGDPLSLLGNIMEDRVSVDMEFFWPKANVMVEYFQGNIRVDDNIQIRMQSICFGAYLKGLLTCHQNGFNLQGGLLLQEGRHEISGRLSEVDPDRELEQDRLLEATLNYTYFFKKHALRWSTSISALTLQVNAPGSSTLAVQVGDSSVPTVPGFPNPEGFTPALKDEHNHVLISQLQWMF